MIGTYADRLALARTADEVEQATATGRIASLLGAEGGHSIGCSLGTLRLLHVLGVRYLTLTHNDNMPWADSATDVPVVGGLSEFGREVVREMNRLGMMVDLTHVAATTMRAALDDDRGAGDLQPLLGARACATPRATCPTTSSPPCPRNGGVCMVTFVPEFVSPATAAWRVEAAAAAAEVGVEARDWEAFGRFTADVAAPSTPSPTRRSSRSSPTSSTCARSPASTTSASAATTTAPTPSPSGSRTSAATRGSSPRSLERSWSEADVAQLVRGNTLRVMRDVEAVARDLRTTRSPSLRRSPSSTARPERDPGTRHTSSESGATYWRKRAIVRPTRRATTSAT